MHVALGCHRPARPESIPCQIRHHGIVGEGGGGTLRQQEGDDRGQEGRRREHGQRNRKVTRPVPDDADDPRAQESTKLPDRIDVEVRY